MAAFYGISFFIISCSIIFRNGETACPANYTEYLCQCAKIITGPLDFTSAQNICNQEDGSLLLFTRSQNGWENLKNSNWNIPNQMWFGMIYDGDTARYQFTDQSEYSFNSSSFYMPWADATKAQTPLPYYTDGSSYLCVQIRPNADTGDLALFLRPCTDVASAVCLIGTLDMAPGSGCPPLPLHYKNNGTAAIQKSVNFYVGTLTAASLLFKHF